jgi:hypothetical protein
MISRAQQILIKRAQREAGLPDSEYREALQAATGCRSSTDPRLTDRHVDLVLAYIEAIFWLAVDIGQLQAPCSPSAVFRKRRFWASKNPANSTSRDRYVLADLGGKIAAAESALAALGFGPAYCEAIRSKVAHGEAGPMADRMYLIALERTLRSKRNQAAHLASAT